MCVCTVRILVSSFAHVLLAFFLCDDWRYNRPRVSVERKSRVLHVNSVVIRHQSDTNKDFPFKILYKARSRFEAKKKIGYSFIKILRYTFRQSLINVGTWIFMVQTLMIVNMIYIQIYEVLEKLFWLIRDSFIVSQKLRSMIREFSHENEYKI